MIVALPLFRDEIAPRFCFAADALVVDLGAEGRAERRLVSLEGMDGLDRLALLRRQGVEVLLCGGIQRMLLHVARSYGIRVTWGLAGAIEQVLAAFINDDLERFVCMPGMGRGRGRGMGRGPGRGFRRRGRGRPGQGPFSPGDPGSGGPGPKDNGYPRR